MPEDDTMISVEQLDRLSKNIGSLHAALQKLQASVASLALEAEGSAMPREQAQRWRKLERALRAGLEAWDKEEAEARITPYVSGTSSRSRSTV